MNKIYDNICKDYNIWFIKTKPKSTDKIFMLPKNPKLKLANKFCCKKGHTKYLDINLTDMYVFCPKCNKKYFYTKKEPLEK